MVGWHHELSGHEFEETPGDSEGWEAWCAAAHGVAKSWTRLNNGTEHLSQAIIVRRYLHNLLKPLSFH